MAASTELLQLVSRHKEANVKFFDKSSDEGDGDTDDDNETQHKELLKNIKSLGKKKERRHKGPLRSEPSQQVSEFNLKSGDDGKIKLEDLVGSLQNTSYHGSLKKSLESLQRMGKTTEPPLPKRQAEKIQRAVAYEETSKDIGKWDPIVQKNRQAEHLSFPLERDTSPQMSTGILTASFKPQTPLEVEIANVLKSNSKVLERKDKELSLEEEEALKTMSLEEALERRNELRKLRVLQSHYEQKCRRMKKIKSKKYHRVKRRAEKRAASKQSFEQLQQENPELAKKELEKAEQLRIGERMSLKHRNTSKWAKNIITKGIKDVEARHAIAEQLRISRQLTENKKELSESEDEAAMEAEEPRENCDNIQNFALLGDNGDNPWLLSDGKKSNKEVIGDQVEDKGRERIRKLESVTANEMDEFDESDEDDADEEETFELIDKNEANAKLKGRKIREKKAKGKKKNVEEEEWKKSKGKKKGKAKRKISEEVKDNSKKKKKYKDLKIGDSEVDVSVNLEDKQGQEVLLMESDGTEMVEHGPGVENAQDDVLDKESSNVTRIDTNLNLNKVFQIEDLGTSGSLLDYTNEDSDDDEVQAQQMSIQEAFANDDVIEEFVKEKADAMEARKPKDVDMSLPGWGDWGGPGVDETKRKKKYIVRAKPAPARKDTKLAHVIINEERNTKFAKNQVSTIPFPFTSREQWERSIRTPLGKHWNTVSVHKKLVEPRVTTLPGTIIEPIQPTKSMQQTRSEVTSERNGEKRKVRTLQSGIKIHN